MHPCMLLSCLGRRRVIRSFQVFADLQGNMRLTASDQEKSLKIALFLILSFLLSQMTYWVIGGDKCSRNGNLARNLNAPKSKMTKELKSDRHTHTHIISC